MGQPNPKPAPQSTDMQSLIAVAESPMLVISATGQIIHANRSFEAILGHSMDDVQGRPLSELLTPDSAEQVARNVAAVAATTQGGRLDINAYHRSGRLLTLDAMLVPATLFSLPSRDRSDVMLILRDITAERQAQAQQQVLIQGLRTVLASAAELMARPDLDSTYRHVVEFTREVLGIERCALFLVDQYGFVTGTYGTNMRGETTDERRNGFQMWEVSKIPREWFQAHSLNEAQWTTYRDTWYDWDGEKAVAVGQGWICLTPIYSAAELIGVVSNDAAISGAPLDEVKQEVLSVFCSLVGKIIERKRDEDDIRRALEKEHELRDLRSRLIQSISHEFRTPFAVILTSAHVLHHYIDQISEERATIHWNTIEQQIAQMTDLLEELLTIEKMDQRRFSFTPKPVDVLDYCSALAQRFAIQAAPGHKVIFTSQGSQPIRLVDDWLLNQILVNLLSNAINYSPLGGAIQFELIYNAEAIQLRVTDDGIGISPEDREHIFELFHRGRNTGTIRGIGLGLSIVQRAVIAHEGVITFESEEGAGTTFIVTLPTPPPPA